MEPRADKKRVRHLSFEEYHKLLEYCDNRLKGIVIVAAWTCLRQGNILGLRRKQVNLSARTIALEGEETKNGENLIVYLSEPAYSALKEVMKIKSPYVFSKDDGRAFHSVGVQRAFKEAVKKAGVEDFRFHDLRQCFASWNRKAGVDIDTLADLMGHKDTRMTREGMHTLVLYISGAL